MYVTSTVIKNLLHKAQNFLAWKTQPCSFFCWEQWELLNSSGNVSRCFGADRSQNVDRWLLKYWLWFTVVAIAALITALGNVAVGFLILLCYGNCQGVILSITQVGSWAGLASKGQDQLLRILCSPYTLCSKALANSGMISSQHFSANQNLDCGASASGLCMLLKKNQSTNDLQTTCFFRRLNLAL